MRRDHQGGWRVGMTGLTAGLALVFLLTPVYGESPPPYDADGLRQTIRSLQDRIERLEAAQSLREVEQEHEELRPRFGLNLGVFGDLNASSTPRGQQRPAFGLGEIGLYSTARSGDRLTFLFEAAIELDEDPTEFEVERYWVGYTFSDRLVVRAGRVHTAIGYWNRTYHHARYFFPTIDRPFVLAYDWVLPTHLVGVEFAGTLRRGPTSLHYELEIGNGPEIDTTNQVLKVTDGVQDRERSKQAALRIVGGHAALPGLTVGLSGTTYAFDVPSLRESVIGMEVARLGTRLEWIAEGWRLANPSAVAWAGYLQGAWKLRDATMPFARVEWLETDAADPYLVALNAAVDRRQLIAGIRHDVEPLHSVLKAQYRRDSRADDHIRHIAELQWAFGF